MLDFDFKIDKNKDCILIHSQDWIANTSNKIQKYRLSGRNVITYLTEVLDVYEDNEALKGTVKPGDIVFLTRVVSEVAQYKGFLGPTGDSKYYTPPIMQIIGVFKGGKFSLDSLDVLFDKIIYKKVDFDSKRIVKDVNDNTTLGEVVKVGSCKFTENWEKQPLKVKKGDLILLKDNISTEITLDGETYYAVSEGGVVGVFKDKNNASLDTIELLNDIILMSPYVPEKMSKSSLLWTPVINYEDLDYSEIYCRNRFKIDYIDPNLTMLKKGDIVIIDRNVTTYVFFNKKRYFVTNGIEYIEGREA